MSNWSDPRFKLHLRPKTTSAAFVTNKIPPLPDGKSVVDVFADFLRYLYKCARNYVEETHSNGVGLWSSLETRTEVVLTHPNGWEGGQQGLMRKAAIRAGLIPDTDDGRSRLSFVTEGEASLHFCIQNGLITKAISVSLPFCEKWINQQFVGWKGHPYSWRRWRYYWYQCIQANLLRSSILRRNSTSSMFEYSLYFIIHFSDFYSKVLSRDQYSSREMPKNFLRVSTTQI